MSIVTEIDHVIAPFSHDKKDINYWYRRTFTNGQRVDLIDYKKKWTPILRVGRGAWLVRTYPMLYGLFDEVMIVLAKLSVPDVGVLYEKDIAWLFGLLDKAPAGIGAFD